MTSLENVRNAVRFQKPQRLPLKFDSLGISDMHFLGPDFVSERTQNNGIGLDHFGCRWVQTDEHNMGQVKEHPLPNLADLDKLPWPDPDNPDYYSKIAGNLKSEEAEGKYTEIGIFMLLFERMHALHGFSRTLEDLYLEPEACAELADRLVDYNFRVIENSISAAGKGKIHSVSFTDDWGTQQNSFVSPDFWREFFQPRYKKIFDLCHRNDIDVWMHSCGKVNDIIEPLIEIKLDVINLQQPRALGIEEIGERYRGRICFSSLCDIQSTLPFKTDAEIAQEARMLLDNWANPQGGFILSDYGDGEAIGVPLDKKKVMIQAFLEHDPFAKASGG